MAFEKHLLLPSAVHLSSYDFFNSRKKDVQSCMHFYADALFISYLPFAKKIDFKIADKPEITTRPKSVDVKEGGNVTFSCNSAANPSPTTSWTKDESPITNNLRISFSVVNKVFTITNVNRNDSGKYRCVANNKLGNDTSEAAELKVKCEFIGLSFKIWIVFNVFSCFFIISVHGFALKWEFFRWKR